MTGLRTAAAMAILLASILGGCVAPGQADLGILEGYQKALMRRSPQPREGQTDLGPLRPAPQAGLPQLEARKNEQTGRTQIRLPLEEAIVRALANSPEIRLVSFDPAVAHEQVVEAAGAFDTIVFGSWQQSHQDEETASTLTSGQIRSRSYQAGIKQTAVTGAKWSLAYSLTGTRESASSYSTLDKYYEPTVSLEVTQPLLRDGGWEVNLAQVRLAQVNEATSAQAFRQKVEETVTKVIGTYWALVQARVDLAIQEHLLAGTVQTLERVTARAGVDATPGQVKQVKAALESRRASIIRARKAVQDVQDALAHLLADPQINLLADCEIIPSTDLTVEQVRIDLADRLITALKHNPVLAQARLAVQEADIHVTVARNQTLPRLDLSASVSVQGLAGADHQAHEDLGTGDYASYAVGLTAEYPLGNRSALAKLRRERLTRERTITEIQTLADQVAVDLKERVRQVNTSYEQMLAQRAAVEAAAVHLQALEEMEQIRGRLTPEFLQVKLQAQESVALAQRSELAAIVEYNTALADLDRASGTVLQVQRVKIALPPATDLSGWVGAPEPAARPPGSPATVLDAYRQALSGG